jgi:hypothetical protein
MRSVVAHKWLRRARRYFICALVANRDAVEQVNLREVPLHERAQLSGLAHSESRATKVQQQREHSRQRLKHGGG